MTVDPETYAARRRIADASTAQLAEAVAACGPGADAYGCWVVTDSLGEHPPRRVWCCTRDSAGWQPGHGSTDERVMDPARAFVVKGVAYYPLRYSIGWQSAAEYKPRTPEQLQVAADARAAKRQAADDARAAAEAATLAADPQLELALEAG